MDQQNYVLGRGKIYFSKFLAKSQTPAGFRYIGNSPEFSLNIESETLDHFNADAGVKNKDRSVILEITASGSFTTDNISVDNLALFFLGSGKKASVAKQAGQKDTFKGVIKDSHYVLGLTAARPNGAGKVSGVTAKKLPSTDLSAGTDFTVDAASGMIHILRGSTSLADGDNLEVSYTIEKQERATVISGTTPVEGAMRFVAQNPEGNDMNWYMPFVKLSPNGEIQLKGDEWQSIPFNVEVLTATGKSAIYAEHVS